MIFKRKNYNQLLDWKNKSKGSKAILIKKATWKLIEIVFAKSFIRSVPIIIAFFDDNCFNSCYNL